MGISVENRRISHSGDGATDEFAFDFRLLKENDIVVLIVDDLGVETAPTLFPSFDPATDTLDPDEFGVVLQGEGGTVYMGTAPAIGETLFIGSDSDFTQENNIAVGALPARTLNFMYDKLTVLTQELKDTLRRIPKLRASTPSVDGTMEEPIEDTYLRWDDSGNLTSSEIFGPAVNIEYDNTNTSLVATDLQAAIDELSFSSGGSGGGLPFPDPDSQKFFLELSDPDENAQWQSATFTGFSSRFGNAFFDIKGVREAINAIFNFAYVLPGANLTSSVATSLREKGDAITSLTLSSNVTRNSDPILDVTFYAGAISPGNEIGTTQTGDPNSGVRTQAWTGSFGDNFTFRVRVRDDGTSNGGTPQNRDVALSYSFVYPYYFGADVPSLTAAQVAGLTKQIINSTANANRVFTFDVGDVFYFAYPASYGALTSILDENGFENLSNFTLRTENITGLDSTPVSYRIYEFNNVAGVSGTTNYTFIR